MKKLNNKGFGFGMMLFLMCVMILFFGIAIYYIIKIYNNSKFLYLLGGYILWKEQWLSGVF